MDAPARRVHPILLAALVLVAVCGYLAGSRRADSAASGEAPPSTTRALSNEGLLIEYPIAWRRAAADPVPRLELDSPVTVVDGSAAIGGLVSGRLAAGETGPLPAAFVRSLRSVPKAEVVNLVSTQAYRYSELSVPAFREWLDVYVVPSEGGAARVMACFAPRRLSPVSQQCERAVSYVIPTGPATPSLTPASGYARSLASILAGLETERARRRAEMSDSESVASVGAAAASLAARTSAAARAVTALEAPATAAPADEALAGALRRMAAAYSDLSEAAEVDSVESYDADRAEVEAAETAVDRALETFTLLGYGRG